MANENQPGIDEVRRQRHESRTNQTFKGFVSDLCTQGKYSEEDAVRYARSVLQHLRRRLTGEEAKDLDAQLPLKLVELLGDSGSPSKKPAERSHKEDFVQAVAGECNCSPEEAEAIIRNVFATVRLHITEGEAGDVASQLPKDLKPLWARPA